MLQTLETIAGVVGIKAQEVCPKVCCQWGTWFRPFCVRGTIGVLTLADGGQRPLFGTTLTDDRTHRTALIVPNADKWQSRLVGLAGKEADTCVHRAPLFKRRSLS